MNVNEYWPEWHTDIIETQQLVIDAVDRNIGPGQMLTTILKAQAVILKGLFCLLHTKDQP